MGTVSHSSRTPGLYPSSMGYTPKFQAFYNQLQDAMSQGVGEQELQAFFTQQCQELGAWERINNLYRIRPKRPVPGESSRLQFFSMNKLQDHFWKNRTNRDLILKMRQGGVTTLSCLIALDKALFEHGSHSAIMAHVKDNVKKYFRITKTAFRQFQKDWGSLYPVTNLTDNVNELVIKETGASLMVSTETKGLTLDFLHIAEACFVDDARISESVESVPLSCWIIMESTPDTASGMFYDLWDLFYKGDTCMYKGHFFPWWFQYPEEEDLPILKPTKDFKLTDKEILLVKEHELTNEHILWRRLKISESGGDEGEFLRKYPEDPLTCFLSGSSSVFAPDVLTALWKNEKAPSFVGDLILG